MKIFIITLMFTLITSQPSPNGFKLQFIGNTRYVTAKEESRRDFCTNFWCTNDAEILFTRASQYASSDPCFDFKNFSIGTAVEVNVVNERYVYRGFISEIEFKYWEKLRRVLVAKINSTDHRVVKIAKNSFQKCIKSRHVLRHLDGHKELIAYLDSIGGSPYLSKHIAWNKHLFNEENFYGLALQKNSSALEDKKLWNEENFEIDKIFNFESFDALWMFLSYELRRCEDNVLCLKFISNSKWNEIVRVNLIEVLEYMNDDFIAGHCGKIELKWLMYKPAIENFQIFASEMNEIVENFQNSDDKRVKIKDLKGDLNWLKIINNLLSENSKVDENEEIYVEKYELLVEMVRNVKEFDKRISSDYFILSYIFLYQFIFVFHFDENFARSTIGTKKSLQRWESCLIFVTTSYLQPAMIYMYNQRHRDEKIKIGAKKFINEAVEEAKMRFISGNKLPLNVAFDVLEKLINLKILISLDDNFSANNLTDFYSDLKLDGSEKFFDSFREMKIFNPRLKREKGESYRGKIEELLENQRMSYLIEDGNLLYIPSMWIIYPWYHPQRPRFFNMATMFVQVLVRIHAGIKDYVSKKFTIQSSSIITGLEDSVQIAYEHYKVWLASNNDLQIAANFLTNPQLFWMARAVFHFAKYHRTITEDTNAIQRLMTDFMHVEFKSKPGFQDAFKCTMSDEEWKTYREYQTNYSNVLRKFQNF